MIRRKLIYDLKGALNSAMDRKKSYTLITLIFLNYQAIFLLTLNFSIQTFPLNSSTPTTNMNRWTINRIHHVSYTWSMGPDPRENCGSGSTIFLLSLYQLPIDYHTTILSFYSSAAVRVSEILLLLNSLRNSERSLNLISWLHLHWPTTTFIIYICHIGGVMVNFNRNF